MFSFAQNEKTRDSGSFCIAIYALYGYNKIDSIPHRRRVCHGAMDYKDITIFLELVRCRNISKTAENLYLSQSAVSSRLKALEAEMGCQLVLRSRASAAWS